MKITIYQLISTLNIEKELLPQKLPIRTAYNLSKIFARAREELEFYQKKFKEIVTQYGEKDENGNVIVKTHKEFGRIIHFPCIRPLCGY